MGGDLALQANPGRLEPTLVVGYTGVNITSYSLVLASIRKYRAHSVLTRAGAARPVQSRAILPRQKTVR